jgi:hypothetical protein
MLSDGEKEGKVNGIVHEYFLDVALSLTPPSIKSTTFSETCMPVYQSIHDEVLVFYLPKLAQLLPNALSDLSIVT